MAAAEVDEEGRSFDRVIGFSDGVFAIAITLLVLNFHIPHISGAHTGTKLLHDLLDQGDLLVGFAVSFFVVARFWLSHHQLSRVLRGVDRRFIVLNLVFLAFIVFVPYPAEVVGLYGNTTTAVVFYAGTMCLTGLLGAALYEYAFSADLIRVKDPAALHRRSR